MTLVNTRLLAHPINWVFVWVTLLLAAVAYKIVHDAVVKNPGDTAAQA